MTKDVGKMTRAEELREELEGNRKLLRDACLSIDQNVRDWEQNRDLF